MVRVGGGRATIEGARREKEGENTYRGVKGEWVALIFWGWQK